MNYLFVRDMSKAITFLQASDHEREEQGESSADDDDESYKESGDEADREGLQLVVLALPLLTPSPSPSR